jgi:hypothetical protein
VERSISPVIFSSICTSTSAEKMVKIIFDEVASKGLIGSLGSMGAGIEDPSNRSDCGEKNALPGCVAVLRVSVVDVVEGNSEPTLYTHRTTSASMWSAVKEEVHKNSL